MVILTGNFIQERNHGYFLSKHWLRTGPVDNQSCLCSANRDTILILNLRWSGLNKYSFYMTKIIQSVLMLGHNRRPVSER